MLAVQKSTAEATDVNIDVQQADALLTTEALQSATRFTAEVRRAISGRSLVA